MGIAVEPGPFIPEDYKNAHADWRISKKATPISLEEFRGLTAAFQQVAGRVFGTSSKLDITMFDTIPDFGPVDGGVVAKMREESHQKHTILKTDNLQRISEAEWNKAKYVLVSLSPEDESKAPKNAFAKIFLNRAATPRDAFYRISAEGTDVRGAMKEVIAQRPRSSKATTS